MTLPLLRIAYVNFWTDPINDRYFTDFVRHNFGDTYEVVEVPHTSTPDILIASVFGNMSTVHQVKAKIKIFFSGENLKRKEYSAFSNKQILARNFDIVLGFEETDKQYNMYKFPLWLLYYKFYAFDSGDNTSGNNIISFIEQQHVANRRGLRKNFCSLVARHDRSGIRTKIFHSVSKIGKVSFGGPFRPRECATQGTIIPFGSRNKIEYIKLSVYNICPENSSSRGYCTEKLFEALQAGCIPIYWGFSIPEELNENKIIVYEVSDEQKFLKNFEVGNDRDFDGPVFSSESEQKVSKYYTDFKDRLQELIEARL